MVLYENDLVKVVEELRLKGYSDTFIIKDNLIVSEETNLGFEEDDVLIEGAYQFDITEEAFNTQNLFALFIPKEGLRGLMIDLLGMYTYMEDQTISRMLLNVPLIPYIYDDADPYFKYGLKKVTPGEFDKNSERYVLRVGYPDFPACPVGSAFSMLGFDEQAQEYIWLATSIIKDSRLRRVAYKAGQAPV
ncbi:hypothetical protein [Pontibacter liquoris]|uniref:hypothetical protein n=1 Tax=Pontibacter liquoris TaxID=2905677 RepID=UPI001FA7EB56|nr:hypothetical protein [Pontibacter liquoris]